MRIATLLTIFPFCEPIEAASQAIPNPLLGSNSNKKAQKSGPSLAGAARQSALGRAFALGLVVLGLAACGSGGQAADAAQEAAADVADSAVTLAASAKGADAETSDSDSKPTSDGTNMLESDDAKASYAMGFGVTGQVTSQFSDAIDHDAFVAGVRAQLEGRDSAVSQEDAQRALTALNETQRAKQALVASATAKEGAKFLADNAAKDGVVTTATGLQYLVLQEGEGAQPSATDTVKTHYEGTLINGEVFDSSVARGEPATFPLNRVIPGWTEALQLMKAGSKYRLFIPPELAYGNQATGSIPPQSTLIFEVELIEILGGDAS